MIKTLSSSLSKSLRYFYNFSDMKLKVDQENFLIIDPQRGGRVIELKLRGRQIIKGEHSALGNGNYLMFPWVNRIQKVPYTEVKHPYTDPNGLPIHGLYVDSPRTATIFVVSIDCIGVDLIPQHRFKEIPAFKETFILSKGKLIQSIKVQSGPEHSIPFCFGYHPYLQIDQQNIKDLQIKTDIKTNIALDQRLVTPYPYQKKDITVKSSQKYDSLFEGGTFLQLTSKDGFNVKISSALPYWQIYTPPDGKRIAVEPMSFTGNLYHISQQGYSPDLKQGSLEITAWQQE